MNSHRAPFFGRCSFDCMLRNRLGINPLPMQEIRLECLVKGTVFPSIA